VFHPPQHSLDKTQHFSQPLLAVSQFQQALPRFHLMDHQAADPIDERAGAMC